MIDVIWIVLGIQVSVVTLVLISKGIHVKDDILT